MATVLLTGLLVSPLLGGLGLLAGDRVGRRRWGRGVAIAALGLATVCAFVLLIYPEQRISLGSWLPGTGEMGLHTGGVGGYVTLAVSLAALSVLALERGESLIPASIAMISLSAACVAFLADHFLLRYVALEIVALCVAVVPLIERPGQDGERRARFVYVLLRIGDAGLLTAILILMDASGTLGIAAALGAASGLSHARLAWVAVGMTLAVWVKAGIWPLSMWKRAGYGLAPITGIWLFDLLVPSLGLYLLYRVTPIIALTPSFRWLVAGAAVVSIVASGLRLIRRSQGTPTVWLGSTLGGIALCCAALGAVKLVAGLLLLSNALQLVFGLWAGRSANNAARVALASSTFPGVGIERWLMDHVSGLRTTAEGGLFDVGGFQLWQGLEGGAKLLYRLVEQEGMERLLRGLWRGFEGGTQLLYRLVEREGMERLLREVSRGVVSGGRVMQRWHTGRLRANLGWTVAALLLAVLLLAARRW